MKILYVTDLHGCRWKYDRLLGAAKDFGATVVINGGDMLPKDVDLFKQDKFIVKYLDSHFARFDAEGIHYLCCLGNDDLRVFDDLFQEICGKYSRVFNLAQRKTTIDGYEFIGMNWVVDYPFRLKDRCRMDTAEYVLQEQYGTALYSSQNGFQEIADWSQHIKSLPTIEHELFNLIQPENKHESIYVIHMPPCGIGLDKCSHGAEVGSKAVYDFFQKNQPKLSLHGHIHESPDMTGRWYSYINNTLCIQPGQMRDFTYVKMDLPDMKYERIIESRSK